MMNPTPTTCIAISFDIPSKLHASGTKSSDPPATPEVPAAEIAAIRLSRNAVGISTLIPIVFAAARESTFIVTAAPAIFIVAPSGIDIEYFSSSSPSFSHSSIFTGMFAAELLVKNAIIPLSFIHFNTSG